MSISLPAQKLTDYTIYHRNIIKAEDAIFIKHNANEGLKIFQSTFDRFDFVFVDDCIEAFELAAFYKQEDYEMSFIKKAIENGFELKCLDYLTLSCPCNNGREMMIKVTVFDDFIRKNRDYLNKYAESCYDNYLKRIDKNLLNTLLKHHIKEQLFKDCPNCDKRLEADREENKKQGAISEKQYQDVLDENLAFFDALAMQHIFPGERNLGIYTDNLAKKLELPIKNIETYKKSVLEYYHLLEGYHFPLDAKIPANTEADYFEINPVYNMLFHNKDSYKTLFKYKDEAIKKGYWHPREFASLMFNTNRAHHDAKGNLHLEPDELSYKPANIKEIDAIRNSLLLPSYEIDYSKHQFAHEHNLRLQFGFFNGTK